MADDDMKGAGRRNHTPAGRRRDDGRDRRSMLARSNPINRPS